MEEARAHLQELESLHSEKDSLQTELKRIKIRLKALGDREAVLEENLQTYCRETGKPGVRYNNTIVMLETKTVRARKKKAQQRADQAEVLRSRGINPDDTLLNALEEARRGEAVETQRLKVQRKSAR